MIKNLCRKLVAAAAVVVLVTGAGVSAQTNTFTKVLDVAPGERRCIDHPTVAYRNASVYDFVVSGEMVKFIFLVKAGGAVGFSEVSSSRFPVLSYSDYVSARPPSPPSFFPDIFPGLFRTCARNDGATPSTVSLSLTVDQ